MKQNEWREKISNRSDLVARLSHLTGRKASNDDGAFEVLWKILTEKRLIASGAEGFINGDIKAVCFQEVPLQAMAENVLRGNTHYFGFGLRVNRGFFYRRGGRPVFYGEVDHLKKILPATEYWRIVSMNLNDPDRIIDWTHEREWRHPGDFEFDWSEIEVIVKDHIYFEKFINRCFEKNQTDILKGIHGIISLDSVIS